jgi:hypothetical protein
MCAVPTSREGLQGTALQPTALHGTPLHGTAKHLAYPPSRLALEHLQLLEVPAARKPAAARRAPKRPLYPQHLQAAHTAQGAHGGLVGRLWKFPEGSGGFRTRLDAVQ